MENYEHENYEHGTLRYSLFQSLVATKRYLHYKLIIYNEFWAIINSTSAVYVANKIDATFLA